MKRAVLTGVVLTALTPSLHAQSQQVKPPIAVYWMNVETSGGFGMAVPSRLGTVMPRGMQGGKRMHLELGSTQSASSTPRASHAIPAALAMGESLPLLTPEAQRAQEPRATDTPERYETPKGRMLLYWGCGETIGQGQPVVIDFSSMNPQDAAKAFRSRSISRPTGPGPGRSRTFGEWPNRESNQPVPQQASLIGDHTVTGNYSPEIRFTVGEGHDFMAPVAFDPVRKTSGGAFQVKWQSVPTALGYFATAVGQGEGQNEVVMWSSSQVQEMGQVLMDYLPPAEVQRLIKERVVMTPQTTECAVPAGIFKREGAMFNFIAYGDEMNVVHPPRPKDPKQVWEQQYAVKVRLKSTGMTMLSERSMDVGRAPGTRDSGGEQSEGAATAAPSTPRVPNASDAVKEGVNILRGIFGR
jgi:hypothetical protein